MKGEIEQAQESLSSYQSMEVNLHRTKKQYQHCMEQLNKNKGKLERAKTDAPTNPKAKAQISTVSWSTLGGSDIGRGRGGAWERSNEHI